MDIGNRAGVTGFLINVDSRGCVVLSEQQVMIDDDVVHWTAVVADKYARRVTSDYGVVLYVNVVGPTIDLYAIVVTLATGRIIEVVDIVAFDDRITSISVDSILNVENIVVQKCPPAANSILALWSSAGAIDCTVLNYRTCHSICNVDNIESGARDTAILDRDVGRVDNDAAGDIKARDDRAGSVDDQVAIVRGQSCPGRDTGRRGVRIARLNRLRRSQDDLSFDVSCFRD